MRFQHTLRRPVTCKGVGLHTGRPVSLTIRPAPGDTGIVFLTRSAQGPVSIRAAINHVVPSELCTALGVEGSVVRTTEHVLAALAGCEIDNAVLEVTGDEIPVMDGSAGPFVRLLRSAGAAQQERRRPYLKIVKPLEVIDGNKRVVIKPSVSTKVTYSIEYNHPLIQRQTYDFDWSTDAFARDIAEARTFGFLREVEYLWSRGLGKGGSLDNTVVLSEREVLNPSGLRYQDECVRHKILDLIGDFSLLGIPVIGHIVAERSGHAMHAKLVERILAETDSWVLLTADERTLAAYPSGHGNPYSDPAQVSVQTAAGF
ncbi:MAG: UDP-3-O-acyl-N-acetylglucosamine deacetylase [Nitrospira sp.]|nr:MAG: UDP-3-O-acyl-N-acetylglucosamine deacetylase [Nitrospira sp.]